MVQESKKEYLKTYQPLLRELRRLEEKRMQLRADKMLPSAIQTDGMPHAKGDTKDLSDYMVQLTKLNEQIDEKKRQLKNIESYIETIAPEKGWQRNWYIYILKRRYMDGLNWKILSKEIGYSAQHVYRMHEKALECLPALKKMRANESK